MPGGGRAARGQKAGVREPAVRGVALINPQSVHLISGRNLSPAGRRGCDCCKLGAAPGRDPAAGEVRGKRICLRPGGGLWGPGFQTSCSLFGHSRFSERNQGARDSRLGQGPSSSDFAPFRLRDLEPFYPGARCRTQSKFVRRGSQIKTSAWGLGRWKARVPCSRSPALLCPLPRRTE